MEQSVSIMLRRGGANISEFCSLKSYTLTHNAERIRRGLDEANGEFRGLNEANGEFRIY